MSPDKDNLAKTGSDTEDIVQMFLASGIMFLGAGVLVFARRYRVTGR